MTGDANRPEPFLNLLVQDCKTKVYSIPGECSVTCGVGLRPVERVVAIAQQKNLLGKDCTETPGRRQGQPEPCDTNQICPTDPPEPTNPPEAPEATDGIGVRIGLDGKGRYPLKKVVNFRALPETGGFTHGRIFWPFFSFSLRLAVH